MAVLQLVSGLFLAINHPVVVQTADRLDFAQIEAGIGSAADHDGDQEYPPRLARARNLASELWRLSFRFLSCRD